MKGTFVLLFVFALLSCNSQTANDEKKLIGNWVGDLKLPNGKYIGKMYLEFTKAGDFFQTTGEGKGQVVSKLTYRISDHKIFYKGKVTGNKELDSDYHFKGEVLVMEGNGQSMEYVRIKDK
jgi:uncharacterized protein (TIGR03066 family)